MKFLPFIIFLSESIFLINTQPKERYWWIYDREDHDIMFDPYSKEHDNFNRDQVKCITKSDKCYTISSELESKSPFDNECCRYKTEDEDICATIFSGKYKKN